MIARITDASYIWADFQRKVQFGVPSAAKATNDLFYERLNKQVDEELRVGRSVVFDASFNYRSDRNRMREIAAVHGAETVVVWLDTPRDVAYKRSVLLEFGLKYRLFGAMDHDEFIRFERQLELPHVTERHIRMSGVRVRIEKVDALLANL